MFVSVEKPDLGLDLTGGISDVCVRRKARPGSRFNWRNLLGLDLTGGISDVCVRRKARKARPGSRFNWRNL